MATATKAVTLITSRDRQGVRIMDLIAVSLDRAKLDGERAQLLIGNGGELQAGISELITRLSTPNQFANEEVRSSRAYPGEYKGPKPIAEQISLIAKTFGLDPASALQYTKSLPALPDGAEGWFAFPSVDAIGRNQFSEIADPAERRCRAIDLLLGKLGESRTFHNYRAGQITTDRLRQHARTTQALEAIVEQQKGDILIVAAQFGLRHRGRSVRRAREVFVTNEFGLGAFEVGCMAFTHPERHVRWEQLHTDCPGDEFSENAGGQFEHAPRFLWLDGRLKFVMRWFRHAYDYFGSVSAFLPQQQ